MIYPFYYMFITVPAVATYLGIKTLGPTLFGVSVLENCSISEILMLNSVLRSQCPALCPSHSLSNLGAHAYISSSVNLFASKVTFIAFVQSCLDRLLQPQDKGHRLSHRSWTLRSCRIAKGVDASEWFRESQFLSWNRVVRVTWPGLKVTVCGACS